MLCQFLIFIFTVLPAAVVFVVSYRKIRYRILQKCIKITAKYVSFFKVSVQNASNF